MSVSRFNEKLNGLLSKDPIEKSDFLVFLRTLAALCKGIHDVRKLAVYVPVIKDWIGGYRNIFGQHKINQEVKKYMNQLCTAVTRVYLTLSQSLNEHEREYTQEFYLHWKQMLSVMKASRRASSFIKNMDQFKHTVTHLRTAELRCEQLAILKVLNLYIERVSQSELNKFKVNVIKENAGIIDQLIEIRKKPSSIHDHTFLHYINSTGSCISSFQPTKIISEDLALNYSKPEFEMWVDFNLIDMSITIVAHSVTNAANQCIGIVPNPKLKECLINGEQLMTVKGLWSICTVPDISQLGQSFTVTIYFPIHVRNFILESVVKNVFKIVSNTNSSCGESCSKVSGEYTPQKTVQGDIIRLLTDIINSSPILSSMGMVCEYYIETFPFTK